MRSSSAPLLATFLTLLLAADALAAPRHRSPSSHLPDARFTHLLGHIVEDTNAQEIGTLSDFVLDAPAAGIEYAIIGSDGFLGLWVRKRAMPIFALDPDTIVEGVLSTSITKAQWRTYPLFAGNARSLSLLPPSRQQLLAARLPASNTGPFIPPSPAGRTPHLPPGTNHTRRLASELLGATVVNGQHQVVGKICDLFLDLDRQKPVLVAIQIHRFLHHAQTFAVPLPQLSPSAGNQFLLHTSADHLAQAPLLSDDTWQAAAGTESPILYRVPDASKT